MAKDLPYFKFFCSEWNDGDITLEDMNVQGLFINVCSYYWSNECILPLTRLKKRFKTFDKEIQTLVKEGLIKVENDFVVINFLNEQKEERTKQSKQKSKGGKASAEARKLKKLQQKVNRTSTENQHVLNSCSTESQLLRKEEKRREKKRKEEIIFIKNDLFNSNQWKESITRIYNCKLIEVEKYLTIFLDEQEIDGNLNRELKEIKTHFRSWFKLQPFKKNISNEPHIPRVAL